MLEVLQLWQSAVHEPMDQGNIFNVDGPGLEELLAYMNQQNGVEEQNLTSAYPNLFGGQMDITALGLQLQPHLPDSSPSTTSSDDTPSIFNSMSSTGIPTPDVTQNGLKSGDANGTANGLVYSNTATSQLQQPTVKSEDQPFAVFSPSNLPASSSIDTPMVSQPLQPPHPPQPPQPHPPQPPLHLGAPGLLHSTVPIGSSTSNLLSLGTATLQTQPPPGVLFPGVSHSAPFPTPSSLLMLNSAPMGATSNPTPLSVSHPILMGAAATAPSLPPHPTTAAALPRPSSTPLPPMPSQKTHISHSSVEKQRRDRINSLLEELGVLIEPSDPKYCGEGGAARRPKHVLLADAIKVVQALISGLADVRQPDPKAAAAAAAAGGAAAPATDAAGAVVANGGVVLEGAGAAAAAAAGLTSANGNASVSSGGSGPRPIGFEEVARTLSALKAKAGMGEAGADGKSEDEGISRGGLGAAGEVNLPQAPEDAPRFHGVMVEQKANNTFEVKVNCRDRRGLMLDIIAAMQNMQLVVTNATVTTKDNMVADIFEVGPGDDRAISSEEIQCSVWRALYNSTSSNKNRSSKRRMLTDA